MVPSYLVQQCLPWVPHMVPSYVVRCQRVQKILQLLLLSYAQVVETCVFVFSNSPETLRYHVRVPLWSHVRAQQVHVTLCYYAWLGDVTTLGTTYVLSSNVSCTRYCTNRVLWKSHRDELTTTVGREFECRSWLKIFFFQLWEGSLFDANFDEFSKEDLKILNSWLNGYNGIYWLGARPLAQVWRTRARQQKIFSSAAVGAETLRHVTVAVLCDSATCKPSDFTVLCVPRVSQNIAQGCATRSKTTNGSLKKNRRRTIPPIVIILEIIKELFELTILPKGNSQKRTGEHSLCAIKIFGSRNVKTKGLQLLVLKPCRLHTKRKFRITQGETEGGNHRYWNRVAMHQGGKKKS